MKYFLFLSAIFLSYQTMADMCRIGQIPWTTKVKAVGYSDCRQYNFNQTNCIKPPLKDEAASMASKFLIEDLTYCIQACEQSGGKFQAATASGPICELVQNGSSVFDYYKCSYSTEAACN